MRELDDSEALILRELVRDPRLSDHGVAQRCELNTRTVNRRRRLLEEEGVVSYHTHVDLSAKGTGHFEARHLYIIRFRMGISLEQVIEDIRREPFVRTVFSEVIFESHIAEIDGRLALLLFIDGKSDADIVQTAQGKVIPSLLRNHGQDSIEEISTIRVLAPVRLMRNYLPFVNMKAGYIRPDWPADAIFVGAPAEHAPGDESGSKGHKENAARGASRSREKSTVKGAGNGAKKNHKPAKRKKV